MTFAVWGKQKWYLECLDINFSLPLVAKGDQELTVELRNSQYSNIYGANRTTSESNRLQWAGRVQSDHEAMITSAPDILRLRVWCILSAKTLTSKRHRLEHKGWAKEGGAHLDLSHHPVCPECWRKCQGTLSGWRWPQSSSASSAGGRSES